MKKFLPAFMLAGVIALALPATGHAAVAGSAPVTVLFNIVHVQAQIIQSVGPVECGVIIQTRTQPPLAVANAEIPLVSGDHGALSGAWTSAPLPNGDYQVAVTCADNDGPASLGQTYFSIPGLWSTGSA